jgi:hypothetical protein
MCASSSRIEKCGTYNNAGFTILVKLSVLRFDVNVVDGLGSVEKYIFCVLGLPL